MADALIDDATKEQLAEAARLLAVAVGYYERRCGEVQPDLLQKLLRSGDLDEETLSIVTAGMQNLVSALAEVTGKVDVFEEEVRH
ncbi:hypothetical protein F2Q65_14875 [Thiohalocapsa marina]|uniref:Uncharacterized protein n=1 Tax=Thiohalocapsa marina TaxID=424902 RepID=A0A5M8FIC3_9GAMM|nr:hypothetical protein [Thiohalocapsa marina]KAA6183720.1 hypothetical protein F2Q65_14875 [Thiohalocapsa marina]